MGSRRAGESEDVRRSRVVAVVIVGIRPNNDDVVRHGDSDSFFTEIDSQITHSWEPRSTISGTPALLNRAATRSNRCIMRRLRTLPLTTRIFLVTFYATRIRPPDQSEIASQGKADARRKG